MNKRKSIGPTTPYYNPEFVLSQLRSRGVRRCEYIFFGIDEKLKACAFVFRIGKRRFGSQVVLVNTDLLSRNQLQTFMSSADKIISEVKKGKSNTVISIDPTATQGE